MKKTFVTSLTLSSALALSAVSAQAAENPFTANALDQGYMQLAGKAGEGKCGEGKCGNMDKAEKKAEGKCGEGKCGNMKKTKEKAEKKMEGKCGEGKCGGAA